MCTYAGRWDPLPTHDPERSRYQRPILSGDGRFDERSAGAVVYRKGPSGPLFLLLKYPAGHWDFPKGNIEKGETPLDTMRREVREETGLTEVHPLEGFENVIEYYYSRGGRRIHKQVTFFLAESLQEKVTLSFEHQDFIWLGYDDAMRLVTYSNSKKLLQAAEEAFKRARLSSG